MEYKQYIVKRRYKQEGIGGYVNIPCGTVCEVNGNAITHKGIPVCATNSKNAYDYFWGYDHTNPEKEIERQKLALELFYSAPSDSGDELANWHNPWRVYGKLIDCGMKRVWNWEKSVIDLSAEKLSILIECVKKGAKPPCLK